MNPKSLIIAFLCCIVQPLCAQVDTIQVPSQVMSKTLKAAVVKPVSYDDNNDNYPTLYLLHGGGGQFSDWHRQTTKTGLLQELSNQYDILIVTPGVGPASYYFDSPLLDSVQYETYITKELIPYIDHQYRTITSQEGRAITGLSMGGHGAMMISAKHPELFAVATSMSGVMNIDTRIWNVPDEFRTTRGQGQKAMLGDINYDAPFSQYTAVGLVDQMKTNGLALLIDCGVDDFLLATNRQMHELLLEKEIPHEYTERPGAHTWTYWTEALPAHLLFIHAVFEKNGVMTFRK